MAAITRTSTFTGSFDPFGTGVATEGVSQVYLTGAGARSYFDIRSIYYYGFSEQDVQAQLPVIHPVLDYSNTLEHQVLGGELSYRTDLAAALAANRHAEEKIARRAHGPTQSVAGLPAPSVPNSH